MGKHDRTDRERERAERADKERADKERADKEREAAAAAASADERERQERVIHTRISERLETELKDRAAALGMSVSNLVRNVLDNAFDLVEDIVSDSASVARSASRVVKGGVVAGGRGGAGPRAGGGRGAGGHATGGDDEVIGWQELVLNLNAVCSRCNDLLPRGADAAIAIVHGGGDRPIVCLRCLEEVRHGSPGSPATHAPDRKPDRSDR